jgi:hypothetical protein
MPGFQRRTGGAQPAADDESDLVFHIPCARELGGSGAGCAAATGAPRWLTTEGASDGARRCRRTTATCSRRCRPSTRIGVATRQASATAGNTLLGGLQEAPPAAHEIDELFRAADWLAVHFRRRVRVSLLCTHALAALMGLSFILFSDIESNRVYLVAFLGLFVLGAAVKLVGRRREWQRKYLDYRGLAEGLRVQLYWRLAGVDTPPNSSLGYDSFLQKQDVDLSWIRHAMRTTGLVRDAGFESNPAWLSWVVSQWVGGREQGGQLAYYRDGTSRRERAYRFTSTLGGFALAGGLCGALALMIGGGRISQDMQQRLLLAMGLLPLLAGIREAYSYKKADKELIKQFRFMTRLFASCRQRLDRAGDERQVRQLLRALGSACLEEHAEWILLHRDRPLETQAMSG